MDSTRLSGKPNHTRASTFSEYLDRSEQEGYASSSSSPQIRVISVADLYDDDFESAEPSPLNAPSIGAGPESSHDSSSIRSKFDHISSDLGESNEAPSIMRLVDEPASVPPLPPQAGPDGRVAGGRAGLDVAEDAAAFARRVVSECQRERVQQLRREFQRHQELCSRLKQFINLFRFCVAHC
jgi:hypothetical protein